MSDLETKPKHLMTDVERVRDLQRKLYRKAKQEKGKKQSAEEQAP